MFAYYFFTGRFQPVKLRCLERAIANWSSSTVLVITEPAPIVAVAPIFTGATSDELEPIKALSPIIVFDLLTPS